jgi:hypothetical protein
LPRLRLTNDLPRLVEVLQGKSEVGKIAVQGCLIWFKTEEAMNSFSRSLARSRGWDASLRYSLPRPGWPRLK